MAGRANTTKESGTEGGGRAGRYDLIRNTDVDGPGWTATIQYPAIVSRTVQGRVPVNAVCPWVDTFLRHAMGRDGADNLQLIKGSHIVVRRLYEGDHAYFLQNSGRRVIFAIPYQRAFTLVGTKDLPFHGNPDDAVITPDEIDYL